MESQHFHINLILFYQIYIYISAFSWKYVLTGPGKGVKIVLLSLLQF